jgi:hypothetical protein
MLSEEVEKSNLPGEEIFGDSIKLNEMLKPVLPYIFVLRCSQATKIDHDDLREKLNSITIIVVDRLTIELILEDTTRRKINSDFAVEHEILYIVNSQSVERIIAGALSEALKGITKNDFERLVRTYRQEPEPTIERARADKTEAERENREHADSDKMVKPVPIAPKEKSGSSGQSGKTDTPKPNNDDFQVHRPSLNLKDTSTCPIEFAKREYEPTGSKFFKEGPVSHKETALSQEDKDIIEDSGREAAARKLKEMGFEVELMPRANPGFDIKGTKAGYELHVEVKAHRKKASVVDLTKREYDDWRDSLRNPSLSWELWNVENLSKNSDETVQITRFSEISEQAMRTRQWMVDLRHCTQTTDYYKAFE